MARASYVASARAMALSVSPLAWFCAAQWPDFTPPLTGSLEPVMMQKVLEAHVRAQLDSLAEVRIDLR
jgi:hypothetical protein